MTSLRLSAAARRDLEEIQTNGLRDFGPAATRAHLAGFERIFALLREHPLAGPEHSEFGSGIRTFSHRPHRILYRVQGDGVLIARILHFARNVGDVSNQ